MSLETVLSRHFPANRYSFYASKANAVCLTREKWKSSFFSGMTMWRISAPNGQDYLYDELKDACIKMIDLLSGDTRDAIVQEFWHEIEKNRYVNSAEGENDRSLAESIKELILDCEIISLLLHKGAQCEVQDARLLLEKLRDLEENLKRYKIGEYSQSV
jgi:hypothetical protein